MITEKEKKFLEELEQLLRKYNAYVDSSISYDVDENFSGENYYFRGEGVYLDMEDVYEELGHLAFQHILMKQVEYICNKHFGEPLDSISKKEIEDEILKWIPMSLVDTCLVRCSTSKRGFLLIHIKVALKNNKKIDLVFHYK